MPWQKHYKYFKPATGLPPHVLMYAYVKDVQQDVNDIPRKLEELLDSRQMLGGVPINQITDLIITAVENGAMLRSMTRDVATIMTLVRDGGGAFAGTDAGSNRRDPTSRRRNMRLQRQYTHSLDGKSRRVPPSWKFPKLELQNLYAYWHCGDETNNIPPMKYLDKYDVDFLGKRARSTLSEHKRVMDCWV